MEHWFAIGEAATDLLNLAAAILVFVSARRRRIVLVTPADGK